MRDVNYSV